MAVGKNGRVTGPIDFGMGIAGNFISINPIIILPSIKRFNMLIIPK
jgi:hypothetical protein